MQSRKQQLGTAELETATGNWELGAGNWEFSEQIRESPGGEDAKEPDSYWRGRTGSENHQKLFRAASGSDSSQFPVSCSQFPVVFSAGPKV
jgi:hypothetical protein